MDRNRAYELLEVAAGAGPRDCEAQRRWKRRQIEEAILTASSDVLKRQYQDSLSELELAFQVAVGDDYRHPPGLNVTRMRDRSGAKIFYAEQRPGESLRVGITTGDLLGGRYDVRHLVGAGGTGAVFEGFDRNLKQDVAIKILLPTLFPDEAARDAYIAVQRSIQNVVHHNVLKVFDVAVSGSFVYVVTRLDRDPTLAALVLERGIAGNAVGQGDIQKMVLAIIDGLNAAGATSHGYLHPETIFCGRTGQLRISDFGATKFLLPHELTKLARVMNTLPYVAPERLSDGGVVDGRSDQYSLGVIAYELLSGKKAGARLEPLAVVAPKCPAAIARCIDRMLEGSPADRFSSWNELRDAWAAFGGGRESVEVSPSQANAKITLPRQRIWEVFLSVIVLAILVVLWRIARME